MNRRHPYRTFFFTLLTGSAFLGATCLIVIVGPCPSKGGKGRQKTGAGKEETLVALAASGSATLQPRYGKGDWWAPRGLRQEAGSVLSGKPFSSFPAIDPQAMLLPAERGLFRKVWAGPPGEGEGAPAGSPAGRQVLPPNAVRFKACVDRYAARFGIKPNLIFAIIKTESNFDTSAVSTAPAYGLMQLVPKTGGRTAYKMVYGEDVVPTREYLQNPDKNIELGTAYLKYLAQEYFDAVKNAESREYCLIAAYNTGPTNVYRVFGSDDAKATAKINSLSPDEVYDYLTRHLPYPETREYLSKVVSSQGEFVSL